MTILIVADLHLDHWADAGRDPFAGIVPVLRDLDGLIIAGDLANDPHRNWPWALARITRQVSPGRIGDATLPDHSGCVEAAVADL